MSTFKTKIIVMTILEMYHRGICLPRKSIAVKAEIQTIFLREIDQIAKSDTFFGGLLKVAEYFLRMDNDLNCIKYCHVENEWFGCNLPLKLMITMAMCLLTLPSPLTHHKRG